MSIQIVTIAKIRIDCGTQTRVKIDQETVNEYSEKMLDGDEFPPIKLFHDGVDYYLADGFHRYHAAKKCKHKTMPAEVTAGTLSDAILYAVGANHKHGKPRTLEDKTNAAMILLSNFEWSTWSTAEIARQCNVSENFVSKLRKGKEPDTFKYKNSDGETVERKRNKPKEENKKDGKKQEQKPKTDDGKLDQANAAIEILVQENQQLIDKLATKDSSDPKVADGHIADLRQQIKELENENKSLIISRNQFQNENDELKKQIKWLEKKIKKLETEII